MSKVIIAVWIIVAVKLIPYIPDSCYDAWQDAQRRLFKMHHF